MELVCAQQVQTLHKTVQRSDVVAARPEPEVEIATGSRRRRATRWRRNNIDCWRRWKTRFLLHLLSMTLPSILHYYWYYKLVVISLLLLLYYYYCCCYCFWYCCSYLQWQFRVIFNTVRRICLPLLRGLLPLRAAVRPSVCLSVCLCIMCRLGQKSKPSLIYE